MTPACSSFAGVTLREGIPARVTVAAPVPPVAPAMVNGGSGSSRSSSKMMESYYMAYAAYSAAYSIYARLSDGMSEGAVSETSSLSVAEPGSQVSVGSSASQARAAKRRRWRANRSRKGASGVSTAAPEPGHVRIRPGFCYLRVVVPSQRAAAEEQLGSNPTFASLLAAPASWFRLDGSEAFVVKVSEGCYHLTGNGTVQWVHCLKAILLANEGFGISPSSLAKRVLEDKTWVHSGTVRTAPALADVCGDRLGLPVQGDRVDLRKLHSVWLQPSELPVPAAPWADPIARRIHVQIPDEGAIALMIRPGSYVAHAGCLIGSPRTATCLWLTDDMWLQLYSADGNPPRVFMVGEKSLLQSFAANIAKNPVVSRLVQSRQVTTLVATAGVAYLPTVPGVCRAPSFPLEAMSRSEHVGMASSRCTIPGSGGCALTGFQPARWCQLRVGRCH